MSAALNDPTYAQLTTETQNIPAPPLYDIAKLKAMRDEAQSMTQESRRDSEISRDYYDGPKQLTPEMRTVLAARRQPEIWINRIRAAVDGVVGVIDSNKVDPRAYPREPDDQNASDVASDTLRYTAQKNHFSRIKADALENGLVEGCYAAIIEGGPDQDVSITKIAWDEFFYDARSKRGDFHDARYLGIHKWMYSDQLWSIYQKELRALGIQSSEQIIPGDSGGADITWQDKPDYGTGSWLDLAKQRVVVVEVYHQDGGTWLRSVFCAAGVLEHGTSPYVDDKGNPRCPIEAQSCFVSRENTRYGIVRDMRPIQDEINMRRQKLLHLLNVRQVQCVDPDAPPVNVDEVRQQAARPDGVLPKGWQIVPNTAEIQGQAELLADSKAEIERMGPNPAILGRQDASASGRADQIRQAAGMVELQRVLGGFADWELRCYKSMWAVQRQFWTAPKWIRVTGDDMSPSYVQINEVIQPGVPAMGTNGQPATDPQGNPIWQKPPVIQNHIAEMDVDIVIDTVPDTASLEQEVWQDLTKLIAANPEYAQQVPFTLAVEMSPLPRKQQLIKQIQAAQQANQAQAQAVETAKAQQMMTEQALKESTAFKNFATGKAALIGGVAQAAAAHMDITQAEIAENQLQQGIPGATGAEPVAPVPALPPPAPQNTSSAQ